ncbi:MAG: hypothetical protein Q4G58_13935 [bacterium]|nr:hypothetical protein [bacterium]
MFRSKLKRGVVSLLTGAMLVGSMVVPAGAAATADTSYTASMYFATMDWSAQYQGGNTTVKGDGTYTVKITNKDFDPDNKGVSFKDAGVFVIDIKDLGKDCMKEGRTIDNFKRVDKKPVFDPNANPIVKVSNVSVLADGKEIKVNSDKVVTGNIEDQTTNYRIDLFNQYGPTADGSVLKNTDVTFKESLEVTFTLSGLSAELPKATATPTATATATPAADADTTKDDTTTTDDANTDVDADDDADTTDDTDETEAPSATATATPDATKKTGDVSLALVYGTLIVCVGGLVIFNLRKKANR